MTYKSRIAEASVYSPENLCEPRMEPALDGCETHSVRRPRETAGIRYRFSCPWREAAIGTEPVDRGAATGMGDHLSRRARSATGKPPVVELVGLPGAGKTASIPWLREALASRGVKTRSEVRLREVPEPLGQNRLLARSVRTLTYGWYRARSVIRYWGAVTIAIRALARSRRPLAEKGPAFRRFAITLDNYDCVGHGFAQEPRDVVIIDEGVAQNAFTLFVNSVHDAPARHHELAAYVAHAPRPDLLVHLRVEPRIGLERLRSRKPIGISARFQDLDPSALERTFTVGATVLEQVISDMERRGCAVLEISADAVPRSSPVWAEVAERIARTVEGVESATTRVQSMRS